MTALVAFEPVGLGLKLRVTNTQDNTVTERVFDRLPVRIGRNSLNDLELPFAFVSQFHAVLELQGQNLMLRDLGSTNGTMLRTTGRVPPNALVDLGPHGYEFAIVGLRFQAFALQDVAAPPEKKRRGAVLSMSQEEMSRAFDPANLPSFVPQSPATEQAAKLSSQLRPSYVAYRTAWTELYRAVATAASSLDGTTRAQFLEQLSRDQPALNAEPDFQRLSQSFGAKLAHAPNLTGSRNETIALQAIKDLAGNFLPGRPIESVVDVVAFCQKLQDALDVFLKCFLPLRDGYKQFETQMDIRRTGRTAGTHPSIEQHKVDLARDVRELSGAILDWSDPSQEGPRAVESTFADLMVHEVAMLNGVMTGVKSLLSELSPAAIEREFESPKRRATQGLQIGPYRFKQLWEIYRERHGDLADDEKSTFRVIFGPQFAQAYERLAGEAVRPAGYITNRPPPILGAPPKRR